MGTNVRKVTALTLISAAIPAIVLMMAAPAAAMPMELVTNGGFETGSLGPWTLSGNGGFSSVTTFAPAAGSWNYRNGAVGSFGTINQTVATIAGRVYSFSFDLTNEGRPTNAFQADLGGTEGVLRRLAVEPVHGPDQPALGDHAQTSRLRARAGRPDA